MTTLLSQANQMFVETPRQILQRKALTHDSSWTLVFSLFIKSNSDKFSSSQLCGMYQPAVASTGGNTMNYLKVQASPLLRIRVLMWFLWLVLACLLAQTCVGAIDLRPGCWHSHGRQQERGAGCECDSD